ncbi:hypothetical protein [Paraburkholderia acidisoli]|uniref:Uncharacterized protein n=1 Tax=Paraburkholderia acidisoli TaxID=2571748 RepID=A0A7Z2GK63_9BURK|nr:hypothetical protein [Paraburkholderia acidisoli]QGZ63312.1 hypothetical protein FAZ98_16045 [Paraburkholderia acidisoli]
MTVYLHGEPGVAVVWLASYEAAGAEERAAAAWADRQEKKRGLRARWLAWLGPVVLRCDALQMRTAPSESNSRRAGGLGDEPI